MTLLVGCASLRATSLPGVTSKAARTFEQFERLKVGVSLSEVRARFGQPDRIWGSGQLFWDYVLLDGSTMVLCVQVGDPNDEPSCHVA